jgi:hypothetical protein
MDEFGGFVLRWGDLGEQLEIPCVPVDLRCRVDEENSGSVL